MRHAIPSPGLDVVRRLYVENGQSAAKIAAVYGCSDATVRKWIRSHGLKVKATGPYSGSMSPNWRGGLTIQDGYIVQYAPHHPSMRHSTRPYVALHRLIMEKAIGRYLRKEEVVHHKNGDRTDNRLENLELLSDSAVHNRLHLCGKPTPLTPEGRRRKVEAGKKGRKFHFSVMELQHLYCDEMWSTAEIGKHFGCCCNTIQRRLREIGVAVRPHGYTSKEVVAAGRLRQGKSRLHPKSKHGVDK